MSIPTANSPASTPLFRRFAQRRLADMERCDFCAAPLEHEHQHLLELSNRQVKCVCDACAILFHEAGQRFQRIPRDCRQLTGFIISDEQWNALGVPIALAFFFSSATHQGITALYPNPGGAMQTSISQEAWEPLAQSNPALHQLRPDVEALLVNRMGPRRDYFLAPIDECYRLIGLIRLHWRGLSGGTAVWEQVTSFFEELSSRCLREASHD